MHSFSCCASTCNATLLLSITAQIVMDYLGDDNADGLGGGGGGIALLFGVSGTGNVAAAEYNSSSDSDEDMSISKSKGLVEGIRRGGGAAAGTTPSG